METSDGSSSGGETCESTCRTERPLFTFKQVIFVVYALEISGVLIINTVFSF